MKIAGQSIRSVERLRAVAKGINNVRLVRSIDEVDSTTLSRIGFGAEPTVGDHLVPAPLGSTTFFNANGGVRTRKDLPKTKKSVDSYRTWRDWHGQEHSGYQSRTVNVYPKEHVRAPQLELHIVAVDGVLHVATDQISLDSDGAATAVHAANIMLECFAEFQMIDVATSSIIAPRLRRLQWNILPPGKYPWSRSKPLIETMLSNLAVKSKDAINHRMKLVSQFSPDFLAMGTGGFCGYCVYGFTSRDLYVLESVYVDNATYLFKKNWEELCKLSKNEIINGDMKHERVVHNKRWERTIRSLLH